MFAKPTHTMYYIHSTLAIQQDSKCFKQKGSSCRYAWCKTTQLLLAVLLVCAVLGVQVSGMRLTLVELLSQFRSVPVSLEQLANMLPRMGPRWGHN